MRITISPTALVPSPAEEESLHRLAHAVLSRFGSEVAIVAIRLAGASPALSARVAARGPRIGRIEVTAAGADVNEAVAAALQQAQAEVGATLERARESLRQPASARPVPRRPPRLGARRAPTRRGAS